MPAFTQKICSYHKDDVWCCDFYFNLTKALEFQVVVNGKRI